MTDVGATFRIVAAAKKMSAVRYSGSLPVAHSPTVTAIRIDTAMRSPQRASLSSGPEAGRESRSGGKCRAVRDGHVESGSKQRLGVGLARIAEHLRRRAFLHHLAVLHDDDVVGQ